MRFEPQAGQNAEPDGVDKPQCSQVTLVTMSLTDSCGHSTLLKNAA